MFVPSKNQHSLVLPTNIRVEHKTHLEKQTSLFCISVGDEEKNVLQHWNENGENIIFVAKKKNSDTFTINLLLWQPILWWNMLVRSSFFHKL